MEQALAQLAHAIYETPLSQYVSSQAWIWPVLEITHFTGLAIMAGAIGVFDMRVLGVGKGLTPSALHQLVIWGVGGFALNALSGLLFVFGAPEQYFFNAAFRVKVLLLTVMGLNVAAFYVFSWPRARALGPGDDAVLADKVIAGISLFALAGVICAGRMLTFFRP